MTNVRPAELLERYGLLLLLALVIVFFTINSATPQFATSENIRNVLGNESVLGIIAVATVIPLVAGHFDLSIGAAAGLSSLITAGLMSKSGMPLAPAVLLGIGTGVAIGVANGILVAGFGLNSIVATLGSSSIVAAFAQWYSEGQTITTDIAEPLLEIGSEEWLGLPRPFFFLVLTALVVWYVLEHTPIGRYLYAAGASRGAAELVGIGVRRFVFWSFVAAGAIAGAAGVLLVAVQGAANPLIGPNYLLPAIAAVFLGATAIKPGRYNVAGTLAAVFFLAFSVNGLTLLGAEPWVNELFNGAALIVAVSIAVWSGKRRAGRPTAPGTRADGEDAGPADAGPADGITTHTKMGGTPDVQSL